MIDFIYRPKDQCIDETEWQNLNALAEQWRSDLSFYADDLKFLQNIIRKYFRQLSKKEEIDLVRAMKLSLIEMNRECESMRNRVQKHLQKLAELSDGPFK